MTLDTFQKGNNEIGTSPAEALEISGGEMHATPAAFDDVADVHIALLRKTRAESVTLLNQILADTMTLRDLYKKHHWQTSGATFYELHLLFDKHYEEQAELIDTIAERIQMLGGTAIAMAADVAVTTMLALPPRDRETPPAQLARLIDAHESVLHYVRAAARRVAEMGDDGTNDLLVSAVIRTNEKQAWFVHELLQHGRVTRVP
jgi:starvation-inducible DNA-binding protein